MEKEIKRTGSQGKNQIKALQELGEQLIASKSSKI